MYRNMNSTDYGTTGESYISSSFGALSFKFKAQ